MNKRLYVNVQQKLEILINSDVSSLTSKTFPV